MAAAKQPMGRRGEKYFCAARQCFVMNVPIHLLADEMGKNDFYGYPAE
jgi:hypothetical protein